MVVDGHSWHPRVEESLRMQARHLLVSLSIGLAGSCSPSPQLTLNLRTGAENAPPRPLQETLFPRWQRNDGRARVTMALSAPQWDIDSPSGACVTSVRASG